MAKSYITEFTNYINSNYDLGEPIIHEKYQHAIRVSSLMIAIALKLKMSNEGVLLAFKIGLLHDLGRFREIVRNKNNEKKLNTLTFDHGAYSVEILYNDGLIKHFDVDKEDDLTIKKALYFHNKKDLEIYKINERELLFTKMLRDMNKLDLLFIRANKRKLFFSGELNSVVLNNYFNNETISIKDLKSDSDRVVFYLSLIKDLYFDESFDMAIQNGYLTNLLNIMEIDKEKQELFDKMMNKLMERKKENVRKKI